MENLLIIKCNDGVWTENEKNVIIDESVKMFLQSGQRKLKIDTTGTESSDPKSKRQRRDTDRSCEENTSTVTSDDSVSDTESDSDNFSEASDISWEEEPYF